MNSKNDYVSGPDGLGSPAVGSQPMTPQQQAHLMQQQQQQAQQQFQGIPPSPGRFFRAKIG